MSCKRCQRSEPEVAFRPKNRATCRDCERQRHRERHAANADRERTKQREYRQRNAPKLAAQQRAWRERNAAHFAEMRRARKAVRRARLRGARVERVYRSKVWMRDKGRCGVCGHAADPADWHLDHVIPLAAGGDHVYENVQVTHPICNLRKGARA